MPTDRHARKLIDKHIGYIQVDCNTSHIARCLLIAILQ